MSQVTSVFDGLELMGFSGLGEIRAGFAKGRDVVINEEGAEWFDWELVRKNQRSDLRVPLGFCAIGQLGSGVKIGVAGDRFGCSDGQIYGPPPDLLT